MSRLICPECERPLKFSGHPHRGQRINCNNCKAKLLVVGVKPFELDLAVPPRAAKSRKETGIVEISCPQCDHTIRPSRRARQSEKMVCSICHTQLEVINSDPLELDVAQIKAR